MIKLVYNTYKNFRGGHTYEFSVLYSVKVGRSNILATECDESTISMCANEALGSYEHSLSFITTIDTAKRYKELYKFYKVGYHTTEDITCIIAQECL